ncbi:MAG: hypothetical protein NDI90_20935 [Nitrospira sp. BO4]|nr:hypothetical protein [Nitrospira sp. BO4]
MGLLVCVDAVADGNQSRAVEQEAFTSLVGFIGVPRQAAHVVNQQHIENLGLQVCEHLLVPRAPLFPLAAGDRAILIPLCDGPAFALGEPRTVAILLVNAGVLLLIAAKASVECDSHGCPLR